MGYKIIYKRDFPIHPRKNTMYIIGGKGCPSQAVLKCQVHNKKLVLNIVPFGRANEQWTLTTNQDNTISLSPSVNANLFDGCGCHFWLENNELIMV